MQELISKAEVLLETLPYLQRFHGARFVIKYGGSFMDSPDPALRQCVARDIVFLQAVGISPVVVHGGGKAITAAMESAGLEARFIRGMRVTDEAAVEIVERVLSGEINPQIVNTITSLGAKARGFSGTDIFTCAKFWPGEATEGPRDPASALAPGRAARLPRKLSGPRRPETETGPCDLGFVGEVCGVNVEALEACLRQGFIPVISPTARGQDGKIYNCNADVAAARTAIALQSRRLIFMSDVPGLLRDAKDPGTPIRHLSAGEVDALIKSGVIDKGMIPKVESAVCALRAGVEKVSLVDGRLPHSILLEMFGEGALGTQVVLGAE